MQSYGNIVYYMTFHTMIRMEHWSEFKLTWDAHIRAPMSQLSGVSCNYFKKLDWPYYHEITPVYFLSYRFLHIREKTHNGEKIDLKQFPLYLLNQQRSVAWSSQDSLSSGHFCR